MLGTQAGQVPSMGETLARLFVGAGYRVTATSRHAHRAIRLLDTVATILRTGRSTDVQVLQVYTGPGFLVADVASWLGRRSGQRVVMHLHGGALPGYLELHPARTRRVLRRADVLVAPSRYLARATAGLGSPVRIIPNLVELAQYRFRVRRRLAPRLLWMRAFHPIYNPLMALQVLARVRARAPQATLVMAGPDKGSAAQARVCAARLGLADAVTFTGFLDPAEKVRHLDAAEVFLNTNHVDNAPVSVLEACAAGLPVVSTDVGGLRDLLDDGQTGLLVPDGDADAMAASVARLLETPSLAERLSREGRSLARQCDAGPVRRQWEQLLADLYDQRRQLVREPAR